MKITPHFDSAEFQRFPRPAFPQAAPYPAKWVETRLRPLCEALEVIRAELGGRSVKVNSGFRDLAYNTSIGSKSTSQHVQGRAADITMAGVPASVLHRQILTLWNEGRLPMVHGLGQYPNFVHVDVRPGKKLVRWTGGRKDNG